MQILVFLVLAFIIVIKLPYAKVLETRAEWKLKFKVISLIKLIYLIIPTNFDKKISEQVRFLDEDKIQKIATSR